MRLHGLDLARFFSLFGMVIVNFKVASGAVSDGSILTSITSAFEGRAAATFVVLAGIGLGMAGKGATNWPTILKRALFLLVLGLLNMLVFDADIIHYYAFYFLFGAMFLQTGTRTLILSIFAINLTAVTLLIILQFDTGWNWETYEYADFWTAAGFTRNLFFNGWHPVFPWLSFLLFGLILARLDLSSPQTQLRLIFWGLCVWLVTEIISASLLVWFSGSLDATILFQTSPVPPVPFYILAGGGAASAVIGICLRLGNRFSMLATTGRQTLTLYFAHIFFGMGAMQLFGLLNHPPLWQAILAACIFTACAVLYANIWSRLFSRGPVELLMRRVAG